MKNEGNRAFTKEEVDKQPTGWSAENLLKPVL